MRGGQRKGVKIYTVAPKDKRAGDDPKGRLNEVKEEDLCAQGMRGECLRVGD